MNNTTKGTTLAQPWFPRRHARPSRAIHIGTRVTGRPLRGETSVSKPAVSPLQDELLARLQRACVPAAPASIHPDQPSHPSRNPENFIFGKQKYTEVNGSIPAAAVSPLFDILN